MGRIASDRPEEIRRMFGRIARWYDLNNRVHSLWQDQRWRRAAVRAASLGGGERVLDAACGTGDLLDLARRKFRGEPIEWVAGDATALPAGAGEFDVVSIAFGLRNVADPAAALAEFRRVLRPGGRLVVLEFDRPRGAVLARALRFYLDRVMPRTAAAIARDRLGAYDYLHRSVAAFLTAEQLAGAIRRAGFADVLTRRLTFGIAALHRGHRP